VIKISVGSISFTASTKQAALCFLTGCKLVDTLFTSYDTISPDLIWTVWHIQHFSMPVNCSFKGFGNGICQLSTTDFREATSPLTSWSHLFFYLIQQIVTRSHLFYFPHHIYKSLFCLLNLLAMGGATLSSSSLVCMASSASVTWTVWQYIFFYVMPYKRTSL